MILWFVFVAYLPVGCAYQRQSVSPWNALFLDFPDHVYVCPKANIFKPCRVAVFRFSAPAFDPETGEVAARAVFNALLQKRVFSYVGDESKQDDLGMEAVLWRARSEGYDLVVTGAVDYYFEGSALSPSVVRESIRVIHVPSRKILWYASARGVACPEPDKDYLFFQRPGKPARPATALVKDIAARFTNMLLKQPKQTHVTRGDAGILTRSERRQMNELQKELESRQAENDLLTRQLLKEIDKSRILQAKMNDLTVQADQLEKQLKEEIGRGDVSLKRGKTRTIIDIDDRICFDSGSAVLKKSARAALTKISKALKNFPDHQIQIQGHTDNVSLHSRRFPSNWDLSTARALAVLRFLLNRSAIPPENFSVTGYGEYHPAVPNNTPQNRRQNRRVEIVISS